MPKPVVIVPYDPQWEQEFATLRNLFADALGGYALAIEHVGSTSVPGLVAKPILDIDIVIAGRDDLPEVISRLQTRDYQHEGDIGIAGREAFKWAAADKPIPMAHNLYVCDQNNRELHRHLAFRDYLRAHPDAMQAYGTLKYELAERFRTDRDGYTNAKTEFVEAILEKINHK